MCKYCEQDRIGATECMFKTAQRLADGDEAFAMDAYIVNNSDLGINLFYGSTILWSQEVKIKYCPMCGRRL